LIGDEADYSSLQNTIELIEPAKTLAISSAFGFAICDSGVWRWGRDQLVPAPFYTPKIVLQIACGWTHSLFRSAQAVYAYGAGGQGQLGLGSLKQTQELSILPVPSPAFVACGFRTSFVVSQSGDVWCFGDNRKGQLGLGHTQNLNEPQRNPFLLSVSQISSGNRHSAAVTPTGLFTWGSNSHGQLGIPDVSVVLQPVLVVPGVRVLQVETGWFCTAVVTEDHQLLMTGRGDLGQLGRPDCEKVYDFSVVLEGVLEVALGSEHSLARTAEGVYGWGWNEHGNLGLGDCRNRSVPTLIVEGPTRLIKAYSACSFVGL
jgi:alpha-tubulin suppressor-like RCC1 family protein